MGSSGASKRSHSGSLLERHSLEHSKASSRYEPEEEALYDKHSRNWILVNWVGMGKRVLEVGCSTGYMSRLMQERHCIVTGIEQDAQAAAHARDYCQQVHVLDLNSSDWIKEVQAKTFDVVLLGDVLEHLIDPRTVLHKFREVLDPAGSVVISLPNVVFWQTRLKILLGRFDYQSCGTLDHTHLRFFTLKTARALIESAGYRIVHFHPTLGGRMSGHVRPLWQVLARLMPGLFGFQFLFEAKPALSRAEHVSF